MGNHREKRQRARERAREPASGSTEPAPAAPSPASAIPATTAPGPPTHPDPSIHICADHSIEDILRTGQLLEGRNMGASARQMYAAILPRAELERGRVHPTTLTILLSLLAVLRSEGDSAGIARVHAERAARSTAVAPSVAPPPTTLTSGYTVQFRPDHMIEDCLNYARLAQKDGNLATAKTWYLDLLEQVAAEQGWKHPMTDEIMESLLEVYEAEGDKMGAFRLVLRWSHGVRNA